ncbi:transposase [Streptomyces massasporeus]|uniref:transposase n=1 Tax=Streptomyces massasporeus TaxID=67324 RepID=UPI00382DD4CA
MTWVTADSTYGQDSHFRRFLEDRGTSYVVAVPKSRKVHRPRIDFLIGQAPPEVRQRLSAGSGAKGERYFDGAAAPPACPPCPSSTATSPPGSGGCWPAAASTSPTTSPTTSPAPRWMPPLPTLSTSQAADGRIQECFQSGKNECGLGRCEVRCYVGWYRHITPAMLAHAFLAA